MDDETRNRAVAWAREMISRPEVVFLDTETTGLGEDAEIIDISIVDRDGRVLLDTLVRPEGPVPVEATRIHGIDDAALSDAPTWPLVYPLVGRILDQHDPVVIYNADFDVRVLEQVNRRHGLEQFTSDWHCAMMRFAEYAGIWHPKYGTWRWQKLEDALRMTNQPSPAGSHRAVIDAESCRLVVHAMARDEVIVIPGRLTTRPDDPDQDWGARSRTESFPGGRITVITANRGCSTTLLIIVGVLTALLFMLACCALIVLVARTLY